MDFRSRIVRPANRHFGCPQAVTAREKQNLRVETESLDFLLLENYEAPLTHERLESTLSILERKAGEDPNESIEDDARGLSHMRLMTKNEGAIERA